MNRLGQNDFSRPGRAGQCDWLTEFSWRKCARNVPIRSVHRARPSRPRQGLLNPLLTIQAANSAYRGRRARTAKGRAKAMSIGDLPVLSALRTRMQWHQERQRVLAENVANSDTPNFKPRDLDGTQIRSDRRQRARRRHGDAADDAHQRQLISAPRGRRRPSTKTARSASRRGLRAMPSISRKRCSRSRPTRWTTPR